MYRRTLTILSVVSSERSLINLAIIAAREWHAIVLKLVNCRWCVATEVFDCVLIAEPVGTLDGVVHVPAPIVRSLITKRRGDAAFGRCCMGTGREDFRNAGGAQASLYTAKGRAQARP